MPMAELKCPCGNTNKWESVKIIQNKKTEAVCGKCGRFVEIDGPAQLNNMIIPGGIKFT